MTAKEYNDNKLIISHVVRNMPYLKAVAEEYEADIIYHMYLSSSKYDENKSTPFNFYYTVAMNKMIDYYREESKYSYIDIETLDDNEVSSGEYNGGGESAIMKYTDIMSASNIAIGIGRSLSYVYKNIING